MVRRSLVAALLPALLGACAGASSTAVPAELLRDDAVLFVRGVVGESRTHQDSLRAMGKSNEFVVEQATVGWLDGA